MDRLWAPWRKAYIRPKGGRPRGCLFCRLQSSSKNSRDYVLKQTPLSFAVLNIYPYNNGHVMIVPKKHTARLSALSAAERLDWLALCDEVIAALEKELTPHGFNLGLNLGRAAGAGIPKHLHLHIVPRWNGDVNFMPVTAGTKVISESLDSVHQLLTRALGTKSKKSKGVRN